MRNQYKIFIVKNLKNVRSKPKRRWKDNIKINVTKIMHGNGSGCGSMFNIG